MKAADRERRDAKVMQLFWAGASYRSIAATMGLRSKSTVGQIVDRQLAAAAEQRELMSDEAKTVWQERFERVWRANYPRAMDGDRYALSELRRLLGHWATIFGLSRQVTVADTGRLDVDVDPAADDDDVDPMDELARLRYNRANNLPPHARQGDTASGYQ